ncbi:hypothetical protein IAQ61_005506 [Plenodomus lingam]|uniref:Similar to methyltransferase type 11 n=1 Tax=Leptosphaeria maculans (strain JN3 / isolate v23.1.3 / race Av1-4-5-6-7-8) TaxID=985895 RepID=E4ZYV4_LEPMJ|nr:similar to methyltransferase type 11 [Plenodomus lingam JN3]KAH9871327.1 hypothetical protein IAQ61_005506 [Plenodomus lingam]CBX96630.1 similar to methyltransferase type 11 [Plenodomus lingam JN3]
MPSNADIARDRFSQEAQDWDSNVKHVESTEKALAAIREYVPAFREGRGRDLRILEIGCGTGLLSFMLAPHIHSLLGVDTAPGMISAFATKLARLAETTARPNLLALEHYLINSFSPELRDAAARLAAQCGEEMRSDVADQERQSPVQFDLVVSHLTLHHIPSLEELFGTLYTCLNVGGWVALTDYEDFGPEAVPFHPVAKRAGVERHGIRRKEIEELLVGAGFEEVKVEEAFVLRKEVEAEGGRPAREMEFPFLVCLGRKG